MITKFSKLVELNKKKLDDIEMELGRLQNSRIVIEKKIEDLRKDFSKIKKPTTGNFTKMNLVYNHLKQLEKEKEFQVEKLDRIKEEILRVQNLHKKANVEFEKMKYLDGVETDKYLKKLAKQEQKDMDEIANILYARIEE